MKADEIDFREQILNLLKEMVEEIENGEINPEGFFGLVVSESPDFPDEPDNRKTCLFAKNVDLVLRNLAFSLIGDRHFTFDEVRHFAVFILEQLARDAIEGTFPEMDNGIDEEGNVKMLKDKETLH